MVSVLIPALNESATIAAVVSLARRSPGVSEVVVIDDGSVDGTPDLAHAAGARVITSTLLGKGASMEDGLWEAREEVVAYLDGDLAGLDESLIPRLTAPVRDGRADLAKARFTRAAGRVTALTARPLLATFFPELAGFEQPLGGLIAARRSFLRNLPFERDYGVDVGLLIDAAATGGHVIEVDIGHIEHDPQPLEALERMARQVARVILDRAARYGRLHAGQVRDAEEDQRRAEADLAGVLRAAGRPARVALFDMDGTLLRDRFILCLARRTNRLAELHDFLDNPALSAAERTRRIAGLFAGVPREVFEQTAMGMALTPGAAEAVVALRKAGYRVGIVTDSYRVAAEVVRRRVFADFSIAHLMRFRHGAATGEVTTAAAMRHPDGCRQHEDCKLNALLHIAERLELSAEHFVAVGDGENDICMLKSAGMGVAFRPKTLAVAEAAQHVVHGDLGEVIDLLERDDLLARSA